MARVDAAGFAAKWNKNLKASTPYIQAGVARVTQAPGVKAAAQAQTMLNNLAARVNDGTWAKQVSSVTLADWQAAITGKGIQRIAAGADAAMGKTTAMAQKLLAAVDASVAVVNQQPRADLQTNIGRAVTFMNEMAARAPKRAR